MTSNVGLSLWMAARYITGTRNPFARFISWISVGGLALGVIVLIVVVSVMNGFDAELRGRILNLVPHVLVFEPEVPQRVSEHPQVEHQFRFFEGHGMVAHDGAVNPVAIYGLDGAGIAALAMLRDSMTYGELDALTRVPRGVVLGRPLANHLGLLPGDPVALVVTRGGERGVRPSIIRLQLIGTFEVGAELDYGLALVSLAATETGELADSGRTGWRLVLEDPLASPALVSRWTASQPFAVEDWTTAYGELFQAVKLEKVMMFVLLLLVVAVAAFNIITGQMLLVNDKRPEIGILVTMGASRRLIVLTFFLQGAVIALTGIVSGALLGILLAYRISDVVAFFEELFGFRILAGTYFEAVPSVVLTTDVLVITGLSAALCVAAAALPARRATGINPIEALHGA